MRVFSPIFILAFLLLVLPLSASAGQGEPTGAVAPVTAPPDSQLSTQLEVYKNTLYNGPGEDIRINAANLLLFSPDPMARLVLMETLQKRDNVAAYAALCKALSQTRAKPEPLPARLDFLPALIAAVKDANPEQSRLAADALLIFDYPQAGTPLETIVRDEVQRVEIRINAMQALGMRPDKGAAITLIAMVDDVDPQISAAARSILKSIGIPVGKDRAARRLDLIELKNKRLDEFYRDRMVLLEGNLQQEIARTAMWRELYLQALDTHYATISDDTLRTTLLTSQMQSPQSERKLWALDKVYQWRLGPGTTPPDSIVPVLLALVADGDRAVRLAAAKQLSYSGRIESAQSLLDRLKLEPDSEVKTEVFVALGAACKSALLRDGIPPEIKKATLAWAATFLEDADPVRASRGADVIGKLMEQNDLASKDTQTYLELLRSRFERETGGDAPLRGDLLRTMAGLCANRSACREGARKQFRPLFVAALEDSHEVVREEAIEGLVAIDKEGTLARLRSDFANDSSAKIRARLIALAEELGGDEDIPWLLPKLGANGDAENAFRTLLAIISRSEVDLLERQWFSELRAARNQQRLSDSQWRSLLERAERMAEGRPEFLRTIYREWTILLASGGALTEQVSYWEKLAAATPAGLDPDGQASLLDIYIRLGRVDESVRLLQEFLRKQDLSPNGPIAGVLSGFVARPSTDGRFLETVRAVVEEVSVTEKRPSWDAQKERWLPAVNGSGETATDGSTE